MRFNLLILAFVLTAFVRASAAGPAAKPAAPEPVVQAHAILTPAEGKRLIAKAVAQSPAVKKALASGMVIITRGTTNTDVAEEILGREIERGAFVSGRVYPAKGGRRLQPTQPLGDIVLINGKEVPDMTLADALQRLKAGDVVIKGANALSYDRKTAGVLIGHGSSGTIGQVFPHVVARKATLIIPVGLEKQIAGDIPTVSASLREPIESLTPAPSMFPVTGQIITEIEALDILGGVTAFQAAAGGIGGAEGAAWIVFRGPKSKAEAALKLVQDIQGEPPFAE